MIYILRAQFHLVNCTMWRQVSKTIANNCQINYWQLRDRCGNLSADALSRSRGVWWYAHVLPATRIDVSLRPATACCCSDCVLLFYSLRLTVPSANSAVRPPKETALARTLSRIDLSRTCFHQTTNRPLLQTAYSPAYSAYSLLSATPSSATLAMPLLSTACGTIKL